MPRATLSTGIELEYDTFGDPSNLPLLLVMGFTAQMTAWDQRFCQQLADGGRFVIRFDNRDCGLSTKFDGVEVDMNLVMTALLMNQPEMVQGKVPYTLSDMAADAVGLLTIWGSNARTWLGRRWAA